jgi:hypothetical protein
MTRPRGPHPWNPQPKTRAIVDQVLGVLAQYDDYLPLTIRLIFYRLVAMYGYAKTDNAYQNLITYIGRARRAGLISCDAIRDDGITEVIPLSFTGKPDFYREVVLLARGYRRDRLEGQPVRIEIWCEAAGMVPQLVEVAHPFGITVYSCSGFDSTTFNHKAAQRASAGIPLLVLHIGDHDFEGRHIFNSAMEDVVAWTASMEGNVRFIRVAVTPQQIEEYDLPTAPPKKAGDRPTCQAEALEPPVLAEIVKSEVMKHLDFGVYQRVLNREKAERAELIEEVERWQA